MVQIWVMGDEDHFNNSHQILGFRTMSTQLTKSVWGMWLETLRMPGFHLQLRVQNSTKLTDHVVSVCVVTVILILCFNVCISSIFFTLAKKFVSYLRE